jgi:hypothetical protein
MNIPRVFSFSIFLFLLSTFAFLISPSAFPQGGSLTPPGAPAPTMKTLDQVQPRTLIPAGTAVYTISSEGSYYLGGNLSIASGNAITVNANNVTIDLQGFEVIGTGGSAGIFLNGGVSNVTIRNGTIRNFTSDGINGQGNSTVRVEKVRALNNAGSGIVVDLNGAVIDCAAEANGAVGIVGTDNCVIQHCQSIGNTGANSHGIAVANAAQISGCVARNNAGSGIVTGTDSTLSACVATNNTTGGISVGDSCTILNSTANQNGMNGGTTAGSHGIAAAGAFTITNCTGNKNTGDGLSVSGGSPGATVHNSTFNGNTLNGIDASIGSVVTACITNNNGGQGINAQLGCRVQDCTADLNAGNGIVLLGVCRAIDNDCRQNSAAGILAQTAGGSRIEGNNVVVNINQGIMVTTTNCLIIRNSARANFAVNYSIVAGNRYGPIVDITAGGTAAVSGSSAADTTTTTHPWANFSY